MSYYYAHNDYELIYLVQDQQDMVALDVIFAKYDRFIYKKILSFHIYGSEQDDFHQEGLIVLHRAVMTFKPEYNKTFMRYFEVLLERKFINLTKARKRKYECESYLIQEEMTKPKYLFFEEPVEYVIPKISFKSDIEQQIYEAYYQKGSKIEEIAGELDLNTKQVYNAIYRIKKKLTQMV
ncbi:MAG: sigma-70 family RNA polymerase sigma factor [Paracholeplasma sp.]|uniref:RNA polymerase sigma-70 factor, ECF subfamily n=1 Tax=Acholeplasma brassicae TaxID=61635 RepID=U4KMF3_9MOLU|nr:MULTISPECIES: sigma-70 family RNA polymerase sigma factor [Paracholeplasma]MDY3195579.1 sigma-70 family RNA polymerase sigma factor [Paracholeplasma sp.]CCV65317.1 RNA polymerase sigma-70 factor, ECF subfamily [Paracholeplasma brassicae]